MSSRAKISVVLCTYNGALFIEEQLNSILAQTYKVDEIIIIDDLSTDDTANIIKIKSEKFPLIKFFKNEVTLGAIKNFERALGLAQNELIAISDQDDIWHPKKVEKLITAISPDTLLIYCNSVRFTNEPDFSIRPNPNYVRFHGTDGRKIFLFNTVSGHASLIRKTLLSYCLPFKNEIMYDWWMAMTAAYNGGVQYVPDVLVLQRVHENNLTTGGKYQFGDSKSLKLYKEMVLPHLKQFIETSGIPEDQKKMALKLSHLWKDSLNKHSRFSLFIFLLKNRKTLFAFKKKKAVLFTHIKYAWRFSR